MSVKTKPWTVPIGMLFVVVGTTVSFADDLEVIDTRLRDQLEVANHAPAWADVPVGPGEAVSSFNGNLQAIHASSPVLPLDGGFSLSLTRTYNSNNVKKYLVRSTASGSATHYSGRSWLGLGWTSHLGRIVHRSVYTVVPLTGGAWNYNGHERFFEFPDGSLYRFEPTVESVAPRLKLQQFVACDGSAPPPEPWPPEYCERYPDRPACEEPPPNPCAGRPANDPAHYVVTFPGGTTYRLEFLVPYEESTESNGYILNHDRGGFYTTEIKDPQGNVVVNVEYWGAEYPFPEAIKKVSSPQYSDMEITTTLCAAGDDPSQCPAAAYGMVKQVTATGFQGLRTQPQQTIQRYFYSTATVTDSDGTHTVALLKEVETEGSDGSSAGSVRYEYGVGRSLGQTVTTYGPLLDRITSPLGAISEYEYDLFHSGSRESSGSTSQRQIVGVVRQTTYPEGLNANGSIGGKPHFSWSWTRDFGSTNCTGGSATVTNSYSQVAPDGSQSEYTIAGDPCGGTGSAPEPFGARASTTILDGNSTTPLRTTQAGFDATRDVDSWVVRARWNLLETEYHDDTGVCFSSTGTEQKSTRIQNLVSDAQDHWTVTVVGGDKYMPLEDNEPVRRVVVTNYAVPAGCTTHLPDTFDARYVEEGLGPGKRYEENFVFDCNGQLVETRVKDEWLSGSTDPDTGSPITGNAGDDGDDLRSVTQHAANGNPILSSALGGDDYPDLSAANTYASAIGWTRGVQSSTQVQGLSYLSSDLTVDPGGQNAASRDPNGLETRFDFDGLGRPLEVDPPGAEHKTRYVYPDLRHVRTITSGGTETTFDPNLTDQLYSEQEVDGLGRVVQAWKAMPDGTRATQVTRYDQLNRAVFTSEWMSESQYAAATKIAWSSGDVDGDGMSGDYFVGGIPLQGSTPWGTRLFYGTPDQTEPGNPLKATPDGLGRVRRVVGTDGAVTRMDYCGPHEQITVEGVVTDFAGFTSNAVTRNYYDALGRLVLVDAPTGVDSEYSYDARGNLTRVNLVEFPTDPFGAWRGGTIPTGQVRTFEYDAAGRLLRRIDPESGERVVDGYDAGGNALTWRDQMALNRGYHFRTTYDAAGRTTKVERIRGTPTTPTPTDESRIGLAGDFEESSDLTANGPVGASWREGSISGTSFNSGQTDWTQVNYGGCLPAAPPGGSNVGGLYMGSSSTCTYSAMASGRKAVRRLMANVERDDVVSFKYWRQVRQTSPGGTAVDRLSVFITLEGAGNDVSGARHLFELDSVQASYATWRQTPDMRPGDLYSEAEWPELTNGTPTKKNVYLYIAFEKGDTADPGSARGVLIDDVFVGRRGRELVAEYSYDTDECDLGAVPDACIGQEPTSHHNGALTKATSYQSGRKQMEERLVYRGLNGRLSGRDMRIDWAGVGQLVTFADRYWFTDQGQLSGRYAPYDTAGTGNPPSRYLYAYKRGYADGLWTDAKNFLAPGASPPSLGYSSAGVLQTIRFANGTSQDFTLDSMHRVNRVQVTGPGGPPSMWDTLTYTFDGAGNIKAFGGQYFSYDLAGRLTGAQVLPQATDPSQLGRFQVLYSYDALGNMTWRDWTAPAGPQTPPPGMEFSHSYGTPVTSKNQIVNSTNHAYDPNGNTTRTLAADTPAAATWSSTGALTAFYNGQPENGSHRVAERYGYDSQGARIVRSAEGSTGDGLVVITIRDAGGSPLSEFVIDPLTGLPVRDRDYLWGVGRLLVERKLMFVLPGGGEMGEQGGGATTQGGGVDPCEVDPEAPGCGGGGGGGGGDPDDPTWVFVDFYHHRDHLGSLRVVTDEAGAEVSKHDFYPFGIEMASSWSAMPGESRMRYTVHERDAATGTDYMMARYKVASATTFLRPDFVDDVRMAGPSSWNKYSYVRGNPLSLVDPSGARIRLDPDYRPPLGPWPVPAPWTYGGWWNQGGTAPQWQAYLPFGAPIGGNGGYGTTGIMDLNRASWFYEMLYRPRSRFTPPWLLWILGQNEKHMLPGGAYASAMNNVPTYNPYKPRSGADLRKCQFGYEVNEFRRGYDQWAAQRDAEWYSSSFGRGCYNTTVELAPLMPTSTHHCRRVIYETGWSSVVPDRNASGLWPAHYKWLIECQAADGSGFEPIEFLDPWGLFFPW